MMMCYNCFRPVPSSSVLDCAMHTWKIYSCCWHWLSVFHRIRLCGLAWIRSYEWRGLPAGPAGKLAKTKIRCFGDIDSVPQAAHVRSSQVKVLNKFTYLGAHNPLLPWQQWVQDTLANWHHQELYDALGETHMEGSYLGWHKGQCTEPMSFWYWCMGLKLRLSWRLLLGDWLLLTHGHSIKSSGSHITHI